MKNRFHRWLTVSMALLVLFSTTSFSVSMHYCGDMLVDVALGTEAKACGMEQFSASSSCEETVVLASCCSEKQWLAEGHEDLSPSKPLLDLQPDFAHWTIISFANEFDYGNIHRPAPFTFYSPPLLIYDLQVMHETYLI
ncbi:HYC_CC_PP family protein [Croceiramulus getboli]|nr:hypothetical protein P8624_10665 [Flavobacteriaceae bacterium YJPT1-3]